MGTVHELKPKKLVDELPDWIPLEAWEGWLEMRRLKKKPLTEGAKERAIQKLWRLRQAGHSPLLVLNQSEDNGYTGLFPVSRTYLDGF